MVLKSSAGMTNFRAEAILMSTDLHTNAARNHVETLRTLHGKNKKQKIGQY